MAKNPFGNKEDESVCTQPQPLTLTDQSQAVQRKIGTAEFLCVIFFVLCIGIEVLCTNFVVKAFSMAIDGNADSLGMAMFGVLVFCISASALAIAIVLMIFASNLSWRFRIITLLPGFVGVLTGVVLFFL